jgi:hypothetical protein
MTRSGPIHRTIRVLFVPWADLNPHTLAGLGLSRNLYVFLDGGAN